MKNKKKKKIYYCSNLLQVDWEKIVDMGMKLVMLDIDNTLEADGASKPSERSHKIVHDIQEVGLQALIVSNARSERGKCFADELRVQYIGHAGKPSPTRIKNWLVENKVSLDQAIMVGDQFFTDLLCARFLAVPMIWVERISHKERWYIQVKRFLESLLAFFGLDPRKAEPIPLKDD